MKFLIATLLILILWATGCGQSEPDSPGSEAAGSAEPAANVGAPAANGGSTVRPSAPAAAKPGQQPGKTLAGVQGPVHQFMTQQLRIFVAQKGRMPENFAEFANTRMDSVPRPPSGFHWAIDSSTTEVKLAKD